MSTPSAAVLRAYAEELRELARDQAERATSCATLLNAVTQLDNHDTWQGSYPSETHQTVQAWVTGLAETAKTCDEQAASWRHLAAELAQRADSLPKPK
ncbi:hypothetical protein ACVW00_000596 [Marmoricola sp. URHA0025 HA25]